ncbi:MAG: hypothetical protein WC625_06100 [Caldisericia bacterium]
MRRLALILIVTMCCVAAGCATLSEPVTPVVTATSGPVPVRLGTYGWLAPGHGVQSDAPVPDEFVADVLAVTAPCGSTVSVDYGRRTQDLFAYLWNDHKPIRVEIRGGMLTLPADPGTYVYSLESTWREGHASHVVKIATVPR